MYSTQHLTKCLIQKQKYKLTSQYIKQLQLKNQTVFGYINDALYHILSTNNNPVTSKLFALRFFKDIFMTAQIHVIDGLNDAIIKQIVKTAQFDKDNKDKMKRGYNYFQQVEKRKKQNDIEKVSYSYVLFSTEIIYVMGNWYQLDQNQEKTDYNLIYQKLKKSGVPFPLNDKQLKFFKVQQRQTFNKNLKQWIAKLPQIQQESQNQQQKNKLEKDQSTNKQVSKKLLSQKNINSSKNPVIQKSSNKLTSKDELKQNKNLLQITQQLRQQNTKLKTDLNNQKLKLFQYEKKIKILQKQSSQKLNQANELKSKNININNEQLKVFKQKAQSFKLQNQKLKLTLTDKQKQLQKLSNDKKNIESQLKNKLQQNHKTILIKQQEIAKLKTQLQVKKNQFNENKKKLSELQKKVKGQFPAHLLGYDMPTEQQKQKITQNLIKSLQKQNSQMKSQINKIKVQQNSLRMKIDSLNIQNAKLIGQNKQLQKRIQSQVKKIKQIQTAKNTEIQKIKQQCKKQISIIPKLQQQESIQSKRTLKKKAIQKRQSQSSYKAIVIQQSCQSPTFKVQKQNSMSEYLKLRQSKVQQINPRQSLRNNFFQQESSQVKNSKFKDLIQDTKEDLRKSLTNIKTKNNSLGKTQCSKQKLRNRRQLQSSRKSCNYNSNEFEYNNSQHNKVQYVRNSTFHRKSNTDSHTNLLNPNLNNAYKTMTSTPLSKKSSMLHLNYKQSQNLHKLTTIIPQISNYFQFKSQYMTNKDNLYFRNLCLKSYKRQNYPIFVDNIMQIKLLNHRNKDTFTLEINNLSYNRLRIRACSTHDQFKIIGDKNRNIEPKLTVQYRIQTHVKDLNLRYPIISLFISQQSKFKNSIRQSQLKYNIPLPLTLLQFTQFQNKLPSQFNSHPQQYKNYRSQTFNLNPKHQSLIRCFKYLKFQKKIMNQTNKFLGKNNQLYWEGTLRHSFIQNIELVMRMQQNGSKVNVDLSFKQYDKISQNYAKVIIQVLMFLLQ